MIAVTVGFEADGTENVETWEGKTLSFHIDPCGALVIFRSPGSVAVAYGPGCWLKVRDDAN